MYDHQPESGSAPIPVRVTDSLYQLDAWALTLSSRGVRSRAREADGMFELYVAPHDVAFALAELNAIDREEWDARRAAAADAAIERPQLSKHATFGAVVVALLLLAFFAVTGPRADGALWFSAGASDAERVLQGELWRSVTALTLHADAAHVFSNVGIGTVVIAAVMRTEGVGFGSALVLASGTAGNLINAWFHQTLHRSVGFSTAVFGAIGILGGIAFVYARRHVKPRRPAWTALAGTLALLALLGMSEKGSVDVLAHVFGAGAGLGLGVLSASLQARPKSSSGQWLAGTGALATVLTSWWVALS
jgi:membrane associated rhomboid family serine protease